MCVCVISVVIRQSVSYASCKPLGAWIKDLLARVDFIRRWSERFINAVRIVLQPFVRAAVSSLKSVEKSSIDQSALHVDSYWLPGFFFPQGLSTELVVSVFSVMYTINNFKSCFASDTTSYSMNL